MAIVYHIHLKDSSINECYIGVSRRSLADRKAAHKYNAFVKRRNTPLYKFMRQYESELLWTVIYEGLESECIEIERKLRPEKNIGWNTMIGGQQSLDARPLHSQYMKQCGPFVTDNPMHYLECRQKMSLSSLDKPGTGTGKNYYATKTVDEKLSIATKKRNTAINRPINERKKIGQDRLHGIKISIDGVTYSSILAATKAIGRSHRYIRRRLYDDNFSNYKFLND